MWNIAGWLALVGLALILIIAGFQGSAGRLMAVVFVPGDLVVGDSAGSTSDCPPGQIKWFGVCQPNPWGFPTGVTGSTNTPTVTV